MFYFWHLVMASYYNASSVSCWEALCKKRAHCFDFRI